MAAEMACISWDFLNPMGTRPTLVPDLPGGILLRNQPALFKGMCFTKGDLGNILFLTDESVFVRYHPGTRF